MEPTDEAFTNKIDAEQKKHYGNAFMTSAGKLPFKHIIHMIGPEWDGSEGSLDGLEASI